MPECVLQAYLDQIPRLRAERMMAAAEAASVPYFEKGAHREWWQRQGQAATAESAPARAAGSGTLFTWNGAPMGLPALKGKLAGVLGGGFSG